MSKKRDVQGILTEVRSDIEWCSDLVLSVIPLVTEANMDNTTLIILIVLVILLGGGGWYGRGRWF